MADAIVSVVLEQLASIVRQQIEQEVTLSKEVKRLASNFQAIQAVLVDAEQRQVKETGVRVWLDKLKDVSYDADNLLDEWNTSKLKLQIQRAENALTLKKKVCSFFLSPCFSFRKVVLHRDIALRIKELNESLDHIAIDKERYNFNTSTSVEQPRGVETTSFVDEYTICGRDKEKNALMSKLLSESSNEHEGLHIISIVGMGGIGKTTLAQLAFNNNEVKNHFEKRIWVCVSDPFDKLRVATAIIHGLEVQSSSSATLESVLQNIHQSIAGKKFLLVLDDVWTEEYNDWEPLYNCLKNCLNGSKIVVTTRKKTVALMMNSIVIPINKLSESECWSLFKHFSFMGRSDDECRELENVGKEIVSKCKGLPLAAKTMGSLLRFKATRKEWENILNSGMWELEEFEKGIFPPLLLSYNDLPLMVKRCFSYCVIFPKDYQLHKDDLIKLWMAQGYLGMEKKREMEMIGEKYFNILATRSFFQEFIKNDIGDIKGCKMHDIVHDFGQFLTKNECFAMKDNDFEDSSISFSFEKARHLILMVDENSSFPISICNIKNLRSLLLQFESDMNSFDGFLLELLGKNTCLRALAIGGTAKFDTMIPDMYHVHQIMLERIPKEIRMLIHLRYLDLSRNNALEMLPEELCELCNLQTLNVSLCDNLKELPQGMGKLINLRHLVNDGTYSLRYMPKGMEKLTCLQTLSEFHVSGNDYHRKACSLEILKHFGHLEGSLHIQGLGNVTDVREAQRIQLKNKKNIFALELGFGGPDSVNNEAIIEALQPPPNLRRLIISGYAGNAMLPNWITSLTNLRSLALVNWINCEQLPPLRKVSSLESIVIHGMKRVKRVGIEIFGLESDGVTLSSSSLSVFAFPKLKSLRFVEMEEWEEWDFGIEDDNRTILPSLRLLVITYCPKLKVLPKQFLQMAPLEVLCIDECPLLSDGYRKGTGENWSDISHIPNIEIDRQLVQRDGRWTLWKGYGTNMNPTPGFYRDTFDISC